MILHHIIEIIMIKSLIKIRLLQLYRGFAGAGFLRIIILVGLIIALLISIYAHTLKQSGAYFVMAAGIIVVFLIQISRKDKTFLKCCFNRHKSVYLVEYLIVSFPILLVLFLNTQWQVLIIYLISLLFVIQINITHKQRSLNSTLQKIIPSKAFEWKAGMRKTLLMVIPVWLITFGTSFFIASVPVGIFFMGIIILSFYEMCEPLQMIMLFEKKPRLFLWDKIKYNVTMFSVLTMPLIFVFIIFHPQIWYIPVVEYVAFVSIYIYVILVKYAFYVPNKKPAAAQIYEIVGILGLALIFLPVIWLLSVYFYFEAHSKLNYYLDDYN